MTKQSASVWFWHDAWLSRGLILSEVIPADIIGITSDYTVEQFVSDMGDWRWDLLLNLPEAITQKLLANTPPSDTGISDELIWGFNPSGKFSISSAVSSLNFEEEDTQFKWNAIWSWPGPQRVRSFLWLCVHDALLTNEKRSRIGIGNISACPRCSATVESHIHILRDCPFIKSIWQCFVPPSHWQAFFTLDKNDWILFGLSNRLLDEADNYSKILFAIVPWLAWRWRNGVVFRPDEMCNEPPLRTIGRYVQDIIAANNSRLAMRLIS